MRRTAGTARIQSGYCERPAAGVVTQRASQERRGIQSGLCEGAGSGAGGCRVAALIWSATRQVRNLTAPYRCFHNSRRWCRPGGGEKGTRCEAGAVPATVSRELAARRPLEESPGRRPRAMIGEPGDLPSRRSSGAGHIAHGQERAPRCPFTVRRRENPCDPWLKAPL